MDRQWGSRRHVLASIGTAGFVAVAGCLEESPGADDPLIGQPEPFVDIELADGIEPPIVHLVDGGSAEWHSEETGQDTTAYHSETHRTQRRIPEAAEPWASDPLDSGDSFDRLFEVEGVYDYASTIDEERGAVGSLVVGWPDPDDQPGLTPPPETYPDAARRAIDRQNERVRDVLEDAHE